MTQFSSTDQNIIIMIGIGGGYDVLGNYIGGKGSVKGPSGGDWGGEPDPTQECNWPYVLKTIPYVQVTKIPGQPPYYGQPYIPPTEAQVSRNNNAGWQNSCSSSILSIDPGYRVKFKVYHDSRGFFIGLDTFGKELQSIYSYRNGLRFTQDGVDILEFGQVISSITSSLALDDEFSIIRSRDGNIWYQINDAQPIKSTNSFFLTQEIYAYGVGYQAGDIILEAIIEEYQEIQYTTKPVVYFDQKVDASLINTAYVSFDQSADAVLKGAVVNFEQQSTAVLLNEGSVIGDLYIDVIVPVINFSNADYSAIGLKVTLPQLELDNDYVPPRLNELSLLVGPILHDTTAQRIHTCEIESDVEVKVDISEENYNALNMNAVVPQLNAYNSPAGYMLLYEDLSIADKKAFLKDVVIPLFMGMKVAGGLELFKDILMVMANNLTINDSQSLASDREISIREVCSVLDRVNFSIDDLPDHSGGTAWVVNIDTGATSIFLDYGFNSFIDIEGVDGLCGVSAGSIVKLQGTSTPVPSSGVDYGLSNFGSPRKKRIPHFYAAVASSGKIYLRLLVDGYQAEYFALTSTDYVEPNKINIGRGFHAVYWNPMIIAPEGVSIEELDSLEWQPMVFPRRV